MVKFLNMDIPAFVVVCSCKNATTRFFFFFFFFFKVILLIPHTDIHVRGHCRKKARCKQALQPMGTAICSLLTGCNTVRKNFFL